VRRTIVGWRRDDVGDWVAELSCLHGQHVRHRPPFREVAWVDTAEGRVERIGTAWECPLCDRAVLPEGLVVVRTTATWDEATAPEALQRAHRVGDGRWGRLRVIEGSLGFRAATTPAIDRTVEAGEDQPIPPEVEHHVALAGPVRFAIDFLVRTASRDEGGDPSCWAPLFEESAASGAGAAHDDAGHGHEGGGHGQGDR
jgi:tellurite resistance-related uncharacterized protein